MFLRELTSWEFWHLDLVHIKAEATGCEFAIRSMRLGWFSRARHFQAEPCTASTSVSPPCVHVISNSSQGGAFPEEEHQRRSASQGGAHKHCVASCRKVWAASKTPDRVLAGCVRCCTEVRAGGLAA